MVLVLLLAEAFVFMVHNFQQGGSAGGMGTDAWDGVGGGKH